MADQPVIDTQEDFLTAFGIDQSTPPAAEPPVTTDPTPAGVEIPDVFNIDTLENPDLEIPDDVPPGGDVPPPATDPVPEQPPAQAPDRASQAFAQMRVENTAYKNTLNGVAALLGITEVNDPAVLAEAIKSKVLEAQAKKDNIPVEYLQKLDRLEQLESQFTKSQLQTQATIGFQKVKDQFGLDDNALVGFAQSLLQQGINPYESPVDLVNEYRTRNWDALMKAAEEKGIAAEAARAAKAAQQGSTPGTNVGGTPGVQDKITTVGGLDDYFSKMK